MREEPDKPAVPAQALINNTPIATKIARLRLFRPPEITTTPKITRVKKGLRHKALLTNNTKLCCLAFANSLLCLTV